MNQPKIENYINHIVFVVDASASMNRLTNQVIKVTDNQVKYLAQRSGEYDQETRVTIYDFSNDVRCLVYDKDVLRMPSIANLYATRYRTSLIDATLRAIDDLSLTPIRYGEHAFLVYVLTDGMENQSGNTPGTLVRRIETLPDNWTVGVFVPNQTAVFEAKRWGFPKNNIQVWDTSEVGIAEVGETIRKTSERFMEGRTRGITGSKNLFKLDAVPDTVIREKLKDVGGYVLLDVKSRTRIDDFVKVTLGHYRTGKAFYELMKPENVQPQKDIAILQYGKVYRGPEARRLMGLPDEHVRVRPGDYKYKVFVQSTSLNRILLPDTQLLVFE